MASYESDDERLLAGIIGQDDPDKLGYSQYSDANTDAPARAPAHADGFGGGDGDGGGETDKQLKMPPVDSVGEDGAEPENPARAKALLVSFIAMVLIGTGNKIFQVLQFIPMYNYPLFVNVLTTFMYVPLSAAYVYPMMKWGSQITPEQQAVPKRVFAVMGILDSIAGIMQSLSVNFIANGSLVTLLMQSAIPISLIISRLLLGTKYKLHQYIGAVIVFMGLGVVVVPKLIHPDGEGHDAGLWSFVLILSCVPMTLSSVYKEKALGDTELDVVYMNYLIAVAQLLASVPLLIPSAPASNVPIPNIGTNLWDGARCLAKYNTIEGGSHPDDCSMAPVYVSVYLCFNITYNILIILILKYGSANVLWLAMTITVPVVNLSFALKFMPNHKPLTWEDVVGLIVIMTGLISYRFYGQARRAIQKLINPPEPGKPLVQPATPGGTLIPPTPGTPGGASTPMLGGGGIGSHGAGGKKRKGHRDARQQRKSAVNGGSGSDAAGGGHSSRYQAITDDDY